MKSLLSIFMAFLFLMHLSTAQAITYVPISFDKLMDETQAIAEVVLVTKRSYKTPLGLISTEYTFEVKESSGLEDYLNSTKLLSFSMVGGSLDGFTTHIDGAPVFTEGEEALILLKIVNGHLYLSNLGVGKYKILRKDGEIFYQSTVFPDDKELGIVSKEKMFGGLKLDQRAAPLEVKDKTTMINHREELKSKLRAPAQAEEKSPTLVTAFILAWLVLMAVLILKKKRAF